MDNTNWVKISGGNYVSGLSDNQRQLVRIRAREQADLQALSSNTQNLIEQEVIHIQEYERAVQAAGGDRYRIRPVRNAEVDRLRIKNKGIDNLLRIERSLAGMLPSRAYKLSTFFIMRFPVTVAQADDFFKYLTQQGMYEKGKLRRNWIYTKEQPNYLDKPEPFNPLVAKAFCRWIGGTFPTAMQWEYAARGSEGLLYPWGESWDPLKGNFADMNGYLPRPEQLQHYKRYTPIDAYPEGASPFGLYDMVGNMPEYVTLPDTEGLHIRGQCLKNKTAPPAWFFYIPLFEPSIPWYTGFRPVRNQWPRSLWPGADLDSPAA